MRSDHLVPEFLLCEEGMLHLSEHWGVRKTVRVHLEQEVWQRICVLTQQKQEAESTSTNAC